MRSITQLYGNTLNNAISTFSLDDFFDKRCACLDLMAAYRFNVGPHETDRPSQLQ
ncbi:hypothetical protein [Methylocaldum szegediense]|uniref:hypothetical protein n=1 Tax=Methylocaldum szegediense TaxID=73780 RepID=UPI000409DCF9|nr:hypothetical protein [Methylocaldum szegediense]